MESYNKRKGDSDLEGGKRQKLDEIEESKGELSDTKKRALSIRLLIEKGDVGSLIGKGGGTIKKFREETGTHVEIDEAIEGVKKRVVTVKTYLEQTFHALYWMAERIQERKKERQGKSGESVEENIPFELTLLVVNPIVGCIIGKAGATVRQIRSSSGADIKVSKSVLDGSSEKTIVVQGSSTQFSAALRLILEAIWDGYDKVSRHLSKQTLYQPRVPHHAPLMHNYPPGPHYSPFDSKPSLPHHLSQQSALSPLTSLTGIGSGFNNSPSSQPSYLSSYYSSSSAIPPTLPSSTQPIVSVVITVPETFVGSVIGRNGVTIEEIRARSGSQIVIEKRPAKVQDAEHVERKITITGTKSCNEIATSLISTVLGSISGSSSGTSGSSNQSSGQGFSSGLGNPPLGMGMGLESGPPYR